MRQHDPSTTIAIGVYRLLVFGLLTVGLVAWLLVSLGYRALRRLAKAPQPRRQQVLADIFPEEDSPPPDGAQH
jgi:hypothetical protein